jgi:predicted nucleic-acid-binding Zn-ribbon protein
MLGSPYICVSKGVAIMAMSTCGKCGSYSFELSEVSASGAAFKYYFIQCSSCGAPAAAVEYNNTSQGIENLENHLKRIEGMLETINSNIIRLGAAIR